MHRCPSWNSTSCSDAPSTAGPEGGHAALRVVNGATTPVAVWADGAALYGRLDPATISPPLPLAPGSRRVELRPWRRAGLAELVVTVRTADGDSVQLRRLVRAP